MASRGIRSLLICRLPNRPSEGKDVIAGRLASGLRDLGVEVLALSPGEMTSPGFWISVSGYDPDIAHYLLGPTAASLAMLRLIGRRCGCPSVVSAVHPLWLRPHRVVSTLVPDLVLTQGLISERLFRSLGARCMFVPNGVDTKRFRPALDGERDDLRSKYGIDGDVRVVLHVGPVRKNRNLQVLPSLVSDEVFPVIVSSESVEPDPGLVRWLIEGGCRVIEGYQEGIEEIYRLADCYVFPTIDPGGCIETPLGVLEAMATNLPVLTTRFGGLPRLFPEGLGMHYFSGMGEVDGLLDGLMVSRVATRRMVLSLDWSVVCERVVRAYSLVLES